MSRREDVDNAIWADDAFLDLSPDAKLLYLWSFTNPRCNMAGLYKVGRRVMVSDTGLTAKRLDRALGELQANAFVLFRDGVLWVRSRVKYLGSRNPNITKSILRDLGRVADHPFHGLFVETYESIDNFPSLRVALRELALQSGKGNGFGTVSERSVVGVGVL